MRLEDLTIALRPRQPWEAVDLGCALTRRDYGRVMLLWLITVVPVWTVLAALLWSHPQWFGLIAWWLKPLYDRVPLFHLSRAAFGSRPTVRETLREWPRLWSRFLLPALLWRRFSFMRSFALPVWMLEGQKGRAARERVATLASDGGSSGASATWVFVKLEIAVWLGLSALASNLGPADGLPDFSAIAQDPESYLEVTDAQQWFSNLLYLTAMSLMEPFYVGAGFGLYLNSRTKLEGWDIELTFRRLAARLKPVVTALLLLACLLPGATMAAAPAAVTPPPAEEAMAEARKAVLEILKREEFKEHVRESWTWVPEGGEEASMNIGWLAYLMYIIGYGLLGAGLVWLVWWILQNRHLFTPGARPARPQAAQATPRIVMGLDITRDSLPEDIVAAARAAWAAGRVREALSLLYRGSLSRLVERHRLPIRDSDTEDDCLTKAAEVANASTTTYFRQLTLLWVRAAYAGREARAEEFEALCQAWPFAASAGHDAAAAPGLLRALVLLPALLLFTGCEGRWEEIEIPLGYQGRARLDPFLAATRLLEERGCVAERLPVLKSLPAAQGGGILISAEAGIPEARARQLLEWTHAGGHLIYAIAGCAPYNDWSLFSSGGTYGYTGNEDRADPVLKTLQVELVGLEKGKKKAFTDLLRERKKASKKTDEESAPQEEAAEAKPEPAKADAKPAKRRLKELKDVPTEVGKIPMGGRTYEVVFPNLVNLKLARSLRKGEWVAGGQQGRVPALHLRHGLGAVTVLNHARPLRNRYLDDQDHAEWFLDLLGDGVKHMQFIVSLEGSFWNLLWKRAWMPLIGLALVTLLWLWKNIPRFGPQRQVVLHDTKHFFEHISALGGFFHRMKRDDILLAAAADAVRTRATRLYPHLIHHNDSALIDLLVPRTDLPVERIRAAFDAAENPSSRDLVRHLQDLQTLRRAL